VAWRRPGAAPPAAAPRAAAAGWSAPRPLDTSTLLRAVRRFPGLPAAGATHASPLPGAASSTPGAVPILAMNGVGFSYPRGPAVFGGVSFEVRPGEAVGLFGPNGAGKSTLLRLAMALEQPTTGTVRTVNRATTGFHPENFAPRVGFLFQQPERQLFATSVRGECSVALQLAGWPTGRIEEAVSGVLEELGLVEVEAEHPYDLPLPRRRLVALASILVAGPELVLLDEPTAGLDAASRDRVIRVIRNRVAGGMTALAITHDAIFAHETLVRAIQLGEGCLMGDGLVRNVLEGTRMTRPAALAVAIELGIPAGCDGRDAVASQLAEFTGNPRTP
jgi:energy-coupling factor transporter ATP-binding protein EcfA2